MLLSMSLAVKLNIYSILLQITADFRQTVLQFIQVVFVLI